MVKNKVKIVSVLLFIVVLISFTSVYAAGNMTTPYRAWTNHLFTLQANRTDKPKIVELQLLEFINGTKANSIVKQENSWNKVPAADEEWLLMKFNMKYVSGPEGEIKAKDIIYSNSNFYTNEGVKISSLDTPSFTLNLKGLGEFGVSLQPGDESAVWYGIMVKKTVGYPLIRLTGYDTDKDSTRYYWASTNPNNPLKDAGVSLDNTYISLNVGATTNLIATVNLFDTSNKELEWVSSNDSVATIDGDGKVIAVGKGITTITATAIDGTSASCEVVVITDSIITPIRYAGTNRYETAVEVSKAGWEKSQNVVLANAYGFADALTGVPFAYIKDAPILLSSINAIPKFTNDEIKRLGAKNIYILGGTGVISQDIESELKSNGFNVFRLSGSNRFETAVKIGNEVLTNNTSKTAIITTAYGYADALAMSSYAAMNKYPILYTQTNALNVQTKEFLKNNGITKVIIPGGIGVVSENVANELKNSGIIVERLAGADRYDTAVEIVNQYKDSFKDEVMISTGNDFPDALAGGVLAAKKQIPILLVNKDNVKNEVKTYIKLKVNGNMYILGGTGVISDTVVDKIRY